MRRGPMWSALAALSAAAALAVTANAEARTATPVRGVQVDSQTTGTLLGSFSDTTVTSFVPRPNGTFSLAFTERFSGCLDTNHDAACGPREPAGTLEFDARVEGKGDASTPTGFARLGGYERVTSGTDGFAGAQGVLVFREDVQTGAIPFHGVIVD